MHSNITTQGHNIPSAPRCPACATCCFWWSSDGDNGERELVCPNCTSYMPTELIADRTGE
ncbi:unnamed protein product [Gemmata massiliana]|uniref:Uncharacterized protein n=1 Tax=Gemmata massiliana TaxID=1210884 RepID=A0A6P2CUY7_9BACT|nr:hypothetical protein [Gemmata massiliana]VTR92176.1 unnamed protein product [Gemmata massiliana]